MYLDHFFIPLDFLVLPVYLHYAMISKTISFTRLFMLLTVSLAVLVSCISYDRQISSDQNAPAWWTNPHEDDSDSMFEKASAEGLPDEHSAREKAYENALSLLSKRIFSGVSSDRSYVRLTTKHYFSDVSIVDERTRKIGNLWNAWILVKYPQEKKKAFLDRIGKSTSNLKEIEKISTDIKDVFKILITTQDMKNEYKAGDKIRFSVISEKDCHIAIFAHQSDGKSILIYPNRWSRNTWLSANKALSVPDPGRDRFDLTVGPPYGDDIIQVIACTSRNALINMIDGEIKKISEGQDFAVIQRGIIVSEINSPSPAGTEGSKEWAENHIMISTFPK